MSLRKFNRRLLRLIVPYQTRIELIRRRARISHEWPSPAFTISIAKSQSELEQAFRLLHNSYVASGYMDPHPTGMRVLAQHTLPQTTTIVAKWDGKVIATFSLIRDNPLGLTMEKIFDLGARRAGGRRLAECSSFAIDPQYRGQRGLILFPLFRFVCQYARQCFGSHELVATVDRSMVDMWCALMCAEKLADKPIPYSDVKGTPAVGLFLNFETLESRLQQAFQNRNRNSNFYDYWTHVPKEPGSCLPDRFLHGASDSIMTPELLGNFFLKNTPLRFNLNLTEIGVIVNAYPYPEYQEAIFLSMMSNVRAKIRLDTQMKAQVGHSHRKSEIWNVSAEGLLLKSSPNSLDHLEKSEVVVWINDTSAIPLNCQVCWHAEGGLYGLRIITPSVPWIKMFRTLEQSYSPQSQKLLKAM